jgi:cystathionine beta-lyase
MAHDFDSVVDRRQTESSKWRKFPADVLPLWVADMDFPSPEPVRRALRERAEHPFYGYGNEQPEFYEVIVDRLQKRFGWRVSAEAIVHLPGVIPGFNLALRSAAAPGDGLLLQTPMYPPILRAPNNCGLTREEAPLGRGAGGRYEIDFDVFRTAIGARTRIFLLCNPHNPVGRVWERSDLARLAEICLERKLVVVSDEIHCDLVYAGHQHVPIASLGPEVERRTITLMAPSKTFNLPGLKSSIAIIPDPALREKFVASQLDLVRAVNIFGYVATLAAYRDGQPWLDDLLRYLEANRDFLAQYVADHLPGVTMTKPEGTYLAWLDCRDAKLAQDDPFAFFLEHAKVALNDGKAFGTPGHGFARLNFGCPRSLLAEGLDRMRRSLEAP